MGFAVGETGVIFVDSKNSPESEKDVLDEIAKITPKPVNTAIILHSDHEKGVTALPAGLTIIAQENTKKEMEVSTARDAVPREYFPTKTVAKDETMTIDGVRVRLLHWAPAHTSGDLTAYFPAQKVVFAGDLLVTDFPLSGTQIHPELHGSVEGWIESVKQMLALDADYVRFRPWRSVHQERRKDETGLHARQVGQNESAGRTRQVSRGNKDGSGRTHWTASTNSAGRHPAALGDD